MHKNTIRIFSTTLFQRRIIPLLLGLLVGSVAEANESSLPKLRFRMQLLSFDSCQAKLVNQGLDSFLKSIEKILPWLDGSARTNTLMLLTGEKLYLRNHPTVALGFSTMGDISYNFGKYCLGHADGTPLNAVLHFTLSATLAHLYGEKIAKDLMDLHEASAEHSFSADGKTVGPLSAMDVFNNYVGINFGTKFKGIPGERDPVEFFIEAGMKLYQAGKLRAVKPSSPDYGAQRCLIPKQKFQGPPLHPQIAKPDSDPRILEYYTNYEIPFTGTIADKNTLTEKDIAAVIDNADPSADPLFLKMQRYRASHDTCCE
jgi:hypothetical protein